MHESAPNDQLAEEKDGDRACLQCHPAFGERIEDHTHHAADSPGSRCYNCHMPYTAFGLLTAMRSHRIDSPAVRSSSATDRPNACNLCHLDRTLGWAAARLSDWYDQPRPAAEMARDDVAAGLLWLLGGDAAQRAVAAWSMGWEAAQEASGRQWMPPFLAELLVDPYAAVRFTAARSLTRLPGFADLAYDYVGDAAQLAASREAVLACWRSAARTDPASAGRLLFGPDGAPRQERVRELIAKRDDRAVWLVE
jgi:hypothetical protein